MTKGKTVDLAEKAVKKFDKASEALDAFLGDPEIRDLMEEFTQLVLEYNQELDSASRAVKAQLKTSTQKKLVIGSFGAQVKYKRWYDTNMLASALPAEQTDEILTEKVVYTLDEKKLDQLLRQGEIDSKIVQEAYHETEQNPANMPGTPKPYNIPALPVRNG